MLPPGIEPGDQGEQAAWNELRPVLHEEVNRLPDKYRIPVILSYLEGKTNEEVAEQLRWPVGTVKGRLSRARDLLRSRLTQRGLALSAAFLMTALSRGRVFAEVVPSDLVRRTVRMAVTPEPFSDMSDSDSPPPPPPDQASTVADLSGSDGPMPRATRGIPSGARLVVIVSLFLAISFSLAIGTCMAVLNKSGGLSSVPRALPNSVPTERIPAGERLQPGFLVFEAQTKPCLSKMSQWAGSIFVDRLDCFRIRSRTSGRIGSLGTRSPREPTSARLSDEFDRITTSHNKAFPFRAPGPLPFDEVQDVTENGAVLHRDRDVPGQGSGRLGQQLSLSNVQELQQAKIGHPPLLPMQKVSRGLQAPLEVES